MQMRGALAMDEKKKNDRKKKKVENLSRVMWWCVGACRGRTDLKLFRTTNREENNKALFSSSSYSFLSFFFFFDWIPPFFLFSYTQTTENSNLYQQPTLCLCVSLFFLDLGSFVFWSHLVVICYTTRQCNQSDSIPRRKHKTLKETKQLKNLFIRLSTLSQQLPSSTYYSNFQMKNGLSFLLLPANGNETNAVHQI